MMGAVLVGEVELVVVLHTARHVLDCRCDGAVCLDELPASSREEDARVAVRLDILEVPCFAGLHLFGELDARFLGAHPRPLVRHSCGRWADLGTVDNGVQREHELDGQEEAFDLR